MQTKKGETNVIHEKAKYKVISGRIHLLFTELVDKINTID